MRNKKWTNTKSFQKANEGVKFYNQIGRIFIFVGIASFILLAFVSLLPQDYEKYNVSLYFNIWAIISFLFVIIGILPLLLGKCSKKYQLWIDGELKSYKNKLKK